jgi:hypothetical protein
LRAGTLWANDCRSAHKLQPHYKASSFTYDHRHVLSFTQKYFCFNPLGAHASSYSNFHFKLPPILN